MASIGALGISLGTADAFRKIKKTKKTPQGEGKMPSWSGTLLFVMGVIVFLLSFSLHAGRVDWRLMEGGTTFAMFS
ncbi:MAG: hypothetical protein R3360_08790, partial [Alphaproteobacteria bacterium]|nr:hypothetical protein [Alphaproteobacteria bacterium]